MQRQHSSAVLERHSEPAPVESTQENRHESEPVSGHGTTTGSAIGSPSGSGCGHDHSETAHKSAKAIVSMDSLGIFASTLCLVHCLAMPFLIAALPLLGLQFLESTLAHRVLAFFVVSFALLAVFPGYMKHKSQVVLAGMFVGLSFVLYATFVAGPSGQESLELPLITVGNLVLVVTHFRNRFLCNCKH